MNRRYARRRLLPLAPFFALTLCAVILSGTMGSCGEPTDVETVQEPLTTRGVPVIRVRLNRKSMPKASVSTTGGYLLLIDERLARQSADPMPKTTVNVTESGWVVGDTVLPGRYLDLKPAPGSFIRMNGKTYRGFLRLKKAPDGGLYATNHLDIESYLTGVLAKELYAGWHPETFRAQAIAARSFAMYQMRTFGRRNDFDLGADTSSQVYGGVSAEKKKCWDAVRSTHGQVLAYGPEGRERLFLVQYSACNGGYVNGAHVLRNAARIPPLMGGQRDPDNKACPKFTWAPVRAEKDELFDAIVSRYPEAAELEGLQTLRTATQTRYGRPVEVELVGTNGQTYRLLAEGVRLALIYSGSPAGKKLYSMNCTITDYGPFIEFANGKGFGHGVGLSQWGAQEKATQGKSAEEILEFYYPGATLKKMY